MPNFNTREMKVVVYASPLVAEVMPLPDESVSKLIDLIIYLASLGKDCAAVVSFKEHHCDDISEEIAAVLAKFNCRICEDTPQRLSYFTEDGWMCVINLVAGSGKIAKKLNEIEASKEDSDDDLFDAAHYNLTQECTFLVVKLILD